MIIKTLKFMDAVGVVHFVRPARPVFEGEPKDYSNSDTPLGSAAVVFQACKQLRRSGVNLGFNMPQYSDEQIKILSKKILKEGNICPVISPAIMAKFQFIEV